MFLETHCSLCDHVPSRFETQCRHECGAHGGLAPTVPVVLV